MFVVPRQRRSDDLLAQAVQQHEAAGRKTKLYDHWPHQAKTWDRQFRVLVKAESGADGTNRRFVVTNRPGDAERLFGFYEARGQHENMIKELKLDLKADRLSCPRFEANVFRLLLAALAGRLGCDASTAAGLVAQITALASPEEGPRKLDAAGVVDLWAIHRRLVAAP